MFKYIIINRTKLNLIAVIFKTFIYISISISISFFLIWIIFSDDMTLLRQELQDLQASLKVGRMYSAFYFNLQIRSECYQSSYRSFNCLSTGRTMVFWRAEERIRKSSWAEAASNYFKIFEASFPQASFNQPWNEDYYLFCKARGLT